MKIHVVRAMLVTALMCASAVLAFAIRPTLHLSDKLGKPDLETLFPKNFGDWRIDANMPVVLPSPAAQALLNSIYNQTLARTYVNGQGQRVMLSVAYGGDQSDGTSAHRPEVCYPAQGFEITANKKAEIRLLGQPMPTRQLMSKLGSRNEPITYWVVVGDQVATSGTEQKLAQLRFGFHGLIPDGMLVRVSSIDANPALGYALQVEFLAAMAEAVNPTQRLRIFGNLRASGLKRSSVEPERGAIAC